MKKNKPYYLAMYKLWMRTGRMREDGLCMHFPPHNLGAIELFKPIPDDIKWYSIDTSNLFPGLPRYWGSGDGHPHLGEFTPLRQTIVLFLAAMNQEL